MFGFYMFYVPCMVHWAHVCLFMHVCLTQEVCIAKPLLGLLDHCVDLHRNL